MNNLVIRVRDGSKMKDAIARTREVIAAKYGFDPTDERALPTWDTVESQKVNAEHHASGSRSSSGSSAR